MQEWINQIELNISKISKTFSIELWLQQIFLEEELILKESISSLIMICQKMMILIFIEYLILNQVGRAGRFGTKGLSITFVTE